MEVGLAVAGLITIGLALGHETVGRLEVLPHVTNARLPGGRFGPRSMTEGMVRVTWHIVTVFALASGGLFLMLARTPASDAKTLLLRWFAAMWIAATAMAFYVTRARLRQLARLPVPLLWVIVAILLWTST